jgi:hypothetical protein
LPAPDVPRGSAGELSTVGRGPGTPEAVVRGSSLALEFLVGMAVCLYVRTPALLPGKGHRGDVG